MLRYICLLGKRISLRYDTSAKTAKEYFRIQIQIFIEKHFFPEKSYVGGGWGVVCDECEWFFMLVLLF